MNRAAFFRRPLLSAGLLTLLGTWLSLQLPSLNLFPRLLVWAGFFAALLAVLRKPGVWPLLLLPASWLNAEFRSIEKDSRSLTQLLGQHQAYAEIRAELMTLPGQRDYGEGRLGPLQAEAKVLELRRGGQWEAARGRIRLIDPSGTFCLLYTSPSPRDS